MSGRPDGHPLPRRLRAALGALALVMVPATLPAQSLGPDPYQPYNSLYKQYVYPTAPPVGGIPNMGRLDYLGSSPSPSRGFSGYLESVGAGTPNPFAQPRGNVSRFTPYYRSYRQFDQEFQRQASPSASDDFFRDQEERHRRYVEALREPDPKKRQELLKKLEADNRAAVRASNDPARFRTYRETQENPKEANPATNRGAANETDTLPDPGPLPPDPNLRSRTPPPQLDLRSLRRPEMGSDVNPSRVLERSRSSDTRRTRRSLELPDGPVAAPDADLDRPEMPLPKPDAPPLDQTPANLLDEPPATP